MILAAAVATAVGLASFGAMAQVATATPAAPAAATDDLGTALALKQTPITGQLQLLANDKNLASVPAALERKLEIPVCYWPEDTPKESLPDPSYILVGGNSLAVMSPKFTNVDYELLIYLRNEFFALKDKPECGRLELVYAYKNDLSLMSTPTSKKK
jgi:hypothetical protein